MSGKEARREVEPLLASRALVDEQLGGGLAASAAAATARAATPRATAGSRVAVDTRAGAYLSLHTWRRWRRRSRRWRAVAVESDTHGTVWTPANKDCLPDAWSVLRAHLCQENCDG